MVNGVSGIAVDGSGKPIGSQPKGELLICLSGKDHTMMNMF